MTEAKLLNLPILDEAATALKLVESQSVTLDNEQATKLITEAVGSGISNPFVEAAVSNIELRIAGQKAHLHGTIELTKPLPLTFSFQGILENGIKPGTIVLAKDGLALTTTEVGKEKNLEFIRQVMESNLRDFTSPARKAIAKQMELRGAKLTGYSHTIGENVLQATLQGGLKK